MQFDHACELQLAALRKMVSPGNGKPLEQQVAAAEQQLKAAAEYTVAVSARRVVPTADWCMVKANQRLERAHSWRAAAGTSRDKVAAQCVWQLLTVRIGAGNSGQHTDQ